ncbi:sigma 54-interacting transcriptional regulator [Aquimarina sp. U1-2]|uniref:sigma-54-dependent Fis family transcriptional regulator n=1 Tax=Aquimarina sp. U1-2 TaxID=2823141 RepID=UPI001AEC7EE5|nr:sigma 54-interacting transcriptional regulator [Aquimarina sp. U1-2]MBP2831818.1 sigma 54-interacting transcriptional regulator [Aquimarina sp. U1-2]
MSQNKPDINTSLLKITQALVRARDRKALLRVIFNEIKTIFPFDTAGLFVIDDEQDLFYELLDEGSLDDLQDDLPRKQLLGPWPYSGSEKDAWIYVEKSNLFDVKEQSKIYPNEQWKLMLERGLTQIIAGALYIGDKKIGLLCFLSKAENRFSEKDFTLFQAIADQVAVALGNVLANEQLVEEKQKTEKLLNITESIANINTGPELVRAIFDKLQKVFPFDEAGLFHLDFDNHQERDLIVDYSYDTSGSNQEIQDAEIIGWLPLTELSKKVANKIVVISAEMLYQQFEHPHFKYTKNVPFRQIIAGPLKQGNQTIGLLYFWSKQEKAFDRQLSLFKSITDQMSVALSNIIANEQLVEEKQKTEDLLAVTESIANITNGPELVRAIFDKLQKVFHFDEAGLFHLDFENQQERDLIVDYSYDISVPSQEIHDAEILGWLPLSELSKKVAQETIIISTETLYEQFEHPHFKYSKKVPFKQVIAGPLKQGDQTIGLLYFWNKQENAFDRQLSLFKSITDQMSVALSNIIANEQLVEEKTFKETLLSISESVARIKGRKELLNVIFNRIQPLVKFDDFGLFNLNESGQYHRDLAITGALEGSHYADEIREQGIADYLPHDESVDFFIQNGPVAISLQELMERFPGHPFYPYMEKDGLKQVFGGPLVYQGGKIGMLAFNSKQGDFYSEKDIPLFSAIANQLAVALSNVLANEEIEQRNLEKSVQISLIESLNKETDWEVRQRKFALALEKLFPWDFIGFYYEKEEMVALSTGFERIGFDEYRKVSLLDFLKITNLDIKIFNEVQADEDKQMPFIQEVKEMLDKGKTVNTIRKAALDKFKLKSVLAVKMPVKDKAFYMFINSKQSHIYNKQHIESFNRIAPSLSQSLEKSLDYEELLSLNGQLRQERAYLEKEVVQQYDFEKMVGNSPAMQTIFKNISEVATLDATVLLLGETGTGKELIARALHDKSKRKDHILVKVNCAAIPSQIVESELFGHEKGAFTGAVQRRVGKFELAHKGTIFLDEIGEMPLELQTKLLRVLQEREVERLGSNETLKLDFRVIAATNRNLEEEVANGKFRADLFYRLNTYPIIVPPLRSRGEDIRLLADFFARQISEKFGLPFRGFAQNTLTRFDSYDWPGNVRELQNLIEQSIISQKGKILEVYPGRSNIPNYENYFSRQSPTSGVDLLPIDENFDIDSIKQEKDRLEKAYLEKVLEKTKWRVSGKGGAARLLGMPPSTLESRMKRLGISRDSSEN